MGVFPRPLKALRMLPVLLLLLFLLPRAALAGEAADITGSCHFRVATPQGEKSADKAAFRDGTYTQAWKSKSIRNPHVRIQSKKPIHGLYLCFSFQPEAYVVQALRGDTWEDVAPGDTRFHHVWVPLEGETDVRIMALSEEPVIMGFNEIFVFGEGEPPEWVQRWNPTKEKAELMFLMTHPDDELIFLGGAIPTYAVEQKRDVVVAYFTHCDNTRRSEALNGLWSMGVRDYPVFLEFRDKMSKSAEKAYANVDPDRGRETVVTRFVRLVRTYRPEVLVTHDLNGEYGHGQHMMVADACTGVWDAAADPAFDPESAETSGTWQIKKLYLHLYGDESNQTRFDWTVPLSSMGGKTGLELASAAYRLHRSQMSLTVKVKGKTQTLSVEKTGASFPNTVFGLYATTVGEDTLHTDFLENIRP